MSPTPDIPVPPAVAVDNGHTLVWDPPATLTAGKRWTCTACEAVAIDYLGNVYGSAVREQCSHPGNDVQSSTGDHLT